MTLAIDDISGVIAHWDAGAITGLVLDDPVSTLPDSISGWNLTGATTTRPLYKPTGINSLPAIQFDGTDDIMSTSSSKSITTPNLGSIMVVRLSSVKDYNGFGSLSAGSGTPTYLNASYQTMGYSNGNLIIVQGTAYIQSAAGLTSAANLIITTFSGQVRCGPEVNGSHRPGGTISANPLNFAEFSGGSKYAAFGKNSLAGSAFNGMLARWVIFSETLLCESKYIEGVLAHEYGITLPTSHPFYAAAPTSPPSSGGTSGFTGLSGVGRLGT